MNVDLEALGPYALVIIAGLFVHACFALSASILTLLGSHAIGAGKRHSTILLLSTSYIIGHLTSTIGLLAALAYFFVYVMPPETSPAAWVIICTLVFVVGCMVLLTYYRRGKGTQLWLPRNFVNFISVHAKKTNTAVSAFGLGAAMVIIELPFLIAPLVLAGAALSTLPELERAIGVVAYAVAASVPLLIVTVLVGGGHKISTIQRWRESNKVFLQWTSGMTLILLSIYLFAINIWSMAA